MSLENIYYIGQTIAVVAILASLIAIFFQMRQGQKLARADSQRDLLKSIGVFLQMTLDNPKVLTDVRQGLQEYDSASSETKSNFTTWAYAYLHVMEQCIYMKSDGLITESSFNGFETGALGIIVTPGGAQWWVHSKKIIGAAVGEHLDKRLEQLSGNTPPIYELLTQFAPIEDEAKPKNAALQATVGSGEIMDQP